MRQRRRLSWKLCHIPGRKIPGNPANMNRDESLKIKRCHQVEEEEEDAYFIAQDEEDG